MSALKKYKAYLESLVSDSNAAIPATPKKTWLEIFIFEVLIELYLLMLAKFKKPIKRKFIFVNSRYSDIILSLDKNEVVVLGGVQDFRFCLKHDIKFVWIGYLTIGFDNYFYYNKKKGYSTSLDLLEKTIKEKIQCRTLLLWEDVLKVGLMLSHVFRDYEGIDVVTIQHGLYASSQHMEFAPGVNSNYNFLIKSSQRRIIGLDSKNSSILGLPYDINNVETELSNKVYLVGTGVSGDFDTIYLYSIWLYSKLNDILQEAGYDVFYRPHHTENVDLYSNCFENIDTLSKESLLTRELSTYIGFESTLLYEANFFNNLTIGINSQERVYPRDFVLDIVIDEKDISLLPIKIKEKSDKFRVATRSGSEKNLKTRFIKCMEELKSHSLNCDRGKNENY